jgi:hypothetical protein
VTALIQSRHRGVAELAPRLTSLRSHIFQLPARADVTGKGDVGADAETPAGNRRIGQLLEPVLRPKARQAVRRVGLSSGVQGHYRISRELVDNTTVFHNSSDYNVEIH